MRSGAWPTVRITLALLVVIPAAMAYPWQSTSERWLLGIAVAVAALLFLRWRGLFATTMVRRRWALVRRNRSPRLGTVESVDDITTVALRIIGAGPDDVLPLSLLAGYLDRYGVRADAVRVSSRDVGEHRATWVGVTLSAVDNLVALRARSPELPLRETAEVAVRRLADQLRENGWDVALVGADDVPPTLTADGVERWRAVHSGDPTQYVAAYLVSGDPAAVLEQVWSHPCRETWTTLTITGTWSAPHVAAACAFRTESQPSAKAPLPGLTPQCGNQRPALAALHPHSIQRLGGATSVDLATLRWRAGAGIADYDTSQRAG